MNVFNIGAGAGTETDSDSDSVQSRQKLIARALKFLRYLIATIIMMMIFYEQAAFSREQWQIDRPEPPPQIPAQYTNGYGSANSHTQLGMPGTLRPDTHHPPGSPAFMNQILGSRIPVGTVLTGVIDADLSSKKSKPGDIFAVQLPEGFVNSGIVVVPPGSKIVGTIVNAASAGQMRGGMPGQLTVGLQSLVFPDGRTTTFHGYIDQNPAHELEDEPKSRFSGFNMGDYGKQVKGMLGSFAGGIGWVHNKRMRGKEFEVEAGRTVAVRVNRTIDLTAMTPALGSGAIPGIANAPQFNMAPAQPAVPGLVNQPNLYQAQAPVQGQPQIPGLMQNASDPRLNASKFTKPTYYNSGAHALNQNAFQGSNPNQNPNAVFHQPITGGDPLKSLPDPF